MNNHAVRWISCGALAVAVWGLASCNGISKSKLAPTITFSASTNTISSGQSVTLNWQSFNSDSVSITASDGSSTRTIVSGAQVAGTIQDSPTATTTYTATASGPAGTSDPQTAIVQVAANVPPQITQLTASPTELSAGQSTTLTWTTTNATSVTFSPGIPIGDDSGPIPTSGSATIPVSATTTYTLTATGPGGSANQTVTVTVPFTLSLIASPGTIAPGQSSTLSWQITGGTATAFTLTDSSGTSVCNPCSADKGTATVTPGTTTTYTATATASDGSPITQTATVTVSSVQSGVIKHIFFMLQENRSFDMYFGQLGAYRPTRLAQFGITDTQTIDAFDPTVTLTNNLTGAKVQPFHEPSMCIGNLTPAWDESHHDTTLNGGDPAWKTKTTFTSSDFGMAGFLDTTSSLPDPSDPNGTRAMGYYNQQDIPYYYDLATFFPTSDTWYSPILANTVPNRMYLMAATSFGHEYPDGSSAHPQYSAPTIFRAMNTANVSWLYYYKDGVFLSNFADFFDPAISGKVFPDSDLMSRLAGTCSGIPCDPDQALPQVIFIDSPSGASHLDEHPDNNVQSGVAYVQSIISALMQSDAWKDSIFILSYDEGGGLYDHAPPFSVPVPDSYAPGQCPDPNNGSAAYCTVGKLGGNFDLTGFRVPLMVLSPYAKPNFVSHIPRDYTAILAFIENQFGMQPLTARDAYWQDPSRDMNEFFDFSNPAMLNAPNGQPWTQVLATQPTNGLCDQTQEVGPTQ